MNAAYFEDKNIVLSDGQNQYSVEFDKIQSFDGTMTDLVSLLKKCGTNSSITAQDHEEICVPLQDGSGEEILIRVLNSDSTFSYFDSNGNLITNLNIYNMGKATGSVGIAKAVQELCAAYSQGFCNTGAAPQVITAQDIVDQAVADGAAYPDGSLVSATDVIHGIDIDMKLPNTMTTIADGTEVEALDCGGVYTVNGGQDTINGAGSRTYTGQNINGDLKATPFEDLSLLPNACVKLDVSFIKVS